MAIVRSIDFNIIKEPWNKYQIKDNSILKTRTILKKVDRITKGNEISFTMDAQTLTVIYSDPVLKGIPNTQKITNDDIVKSIDMPDIGYDTLSQEFNEYFLDDGTKIKIFTNVTSISRTTLKDAKGDPIYHIQSTNTIEIKPSGQYRTEYKQREA